MQIFNFITKLFGTGKKFKTGREGCIVRLISTITEVELFRKTEELS